METKIQKWGNSLACIIPKAFAQDTPVIITGNNLNQAFEAAQDMITGDPKLFGDQAPQLDDNSDGFYTSRDGTKAGQIFLGKEGVQAAEPPVITTFHPAIDLPQGTADALLWVKTSPSGDERIKKVKAVLIPPDFRTTNYEGDETLFSEEELELKYNGALDRYEVLYDNFRREGSWRIMYQAQGADGAWSETEFGQIKAGGASEVIMSVGLNQTEYHVAEKLRFDVTLNGDVSVDMYVAIIFPQGFFQTFTFPQLMNVVNVLAPYQPGVVLSGQKSFSVLEWILPQLGSGVYQACALVTPSDSDPWDIEGWYAFECRDFEVK